MSLTIVRLYHDLLGTYGDQGNAEILIHRAKGRNLDVQLVEVTPGMAVPRSGCAITRSTGMSTSKIGIIKLLR